MNHQHRYRRKQKQHARCNNNNEKTVTSLSTNQQRNSRYMNSRMLLIVSVLLVCFVSVVTGSSDYFDIVDTNHDGVIDRTEYGIGIDNFMKELKEHKDSITSSSWFRDLLSFDSFQVSKGSGFWKGFTSSLAMIIATEIGDKTFFIAAVLSMKHDRWTVFVGAILALIIMTILSTGMGLILPKFLDKKYTHILSGLLFLYFGFKLIYDSRQMEVGKHSEELEEVEEELFQQTDKKGDNTVLPMTNNSTNSGNNSNNNDDPSGKKGKPLLSKKSNQAIIFMALSLTFLAEWGDRSQIATIALASAKHPLGVTIGGILGHCICTSAACIGGRMLASNISEKTVSFWGGIVFLCFGIHSLFFEE